MKTREPPPFPESGAQEGGAPAREMGSPGEVGGQPQCGWSPQSLRPLSGPRDPNPSHPSLRGRVVVMETPPLSHCASELRILESIKKFN